MSTFKAAAIQLNSQPDIKQSMKSARFFVEKAKEQGAELICLPENFAFFGDEKEKLRRGAEIADIVEKELPVWASEFEVTLLGGGYPATARDGKIYNRSILILPDGTIASRYNKVHLFDAEVSDEEIYRESDTVEGGTPAGVVFETESLGNIGFSICYDVRFPELYRQLSSNGTDIITVPSAFTKPTGEAHWEVLLRARAIENSAYVVAPAQTGKHGKKRETWGHSLIIDPWGKILNDAGTEPGVVIAEIDLQFLKRVRRKLPSIEHRRM